MSLNCSDYADYSKVFHEPGSYGLLNLPFQRQLESCRKFTSQVIESVINNITSKIVDQDLAQLFRNAWPNTLDTTIQATACFKTSDHCNPLSYVITGDINAMWLRDSSNQLLSYIDYVQQDLKLKRLFLGAIYLQAHFINTDPYANAFNEPKSIVNLAKLNQKSDSELLDGDKFYERKWEIDSLASFIQLSYSYWQATGDDSFIENTVWTKAVDIILKTVQKNQEPTMNETTGTNALKNSSANVYVFSFYWQPGEPLSTDYVFSQQTDLPTETQFLHGIGQPVKYTGMVKSLFRPSDDATLFTFFIPGNAMLSVELEHLSQLLFRHNQSQPMAKKSSLLSKQIREGIYKYGLVNHSKYGQVFAYEVDGYGSSLIMDDANIPSLLSLSYLGFVDSNDPIYKNTRKLIWSRDNPYFFSGPRGSGIGSPHIGLKYVWPMSQIVRILSSNDDQEIREALHTLVSFANNTGLIHESVNVYAQNGGDDNKGYTRSWFAWANGLFGQAVLKIAHERPHIIF